MPASQTQAIPPNSWKDTVWHRYLRRPYKLHVQDQGGPADKPVIIFLHGLASSSANWDYLIPLLQDSYRCVGIDLIGFGESPKPQWYGYTVKEHLRDIDVAIRGLGLRGPFTLVGHSLGSLLATRYARQHQRRISHLILLSPPVLAPVNTIVSRRARQRTSLYLRAYRFIRTHPSVTPANVLRLSRILPPIKSLVLKPATWVPFVRSLEQCIEHQTIIEDIVEVQAPIDIFYGIFDQVIVPYNIRQLAELRDVTIHPLKVDHNVGKRYARLVAEVINVPALQSATLQAH